MDLAASERWDLFCHHAADVTNYKSPDFDLVSALANNTRNIGAVLAALRTTRIVLTGSVFENDEGAGSEGLPAFSSYGLSKGFTYQVFRYCALRAGLALGKFVIANPFGPHEDARFTAYLMKTWLAGQRATVSTPAYVRDNIHVSLLAKAYTRFAAGLPDGPGLFSAHPSGYVETQGAFSARVAAAVREHGVTVFPGVATMFRRLLDAPDVRPSDFAGLRLASSGAAPCPWPLAAEWRERTGVRILRGYGMTELFRPISYLAADPVERPDAIGRAVPGVELRVLDDDGGLLPPGASGELWIRSPAAMDAYLDAPGDTRAVLAGGWFRTGDLARIGDDGLVTIEGRKRERILRGGYSVFPPEVEAVLLAHPAVAEAAVIGVPDADLGEEVAAFVVLRPGAAASPGQLTAWCRERLAPFKYPRRVRIETELPRAATGKVLKRELLRDRSR